MRLPSRLLRRAKGKGTVSVSSFRGRFLKGRAFEGPWPGQVSRCMSPVDLKGPQGGRVQGRNQMARPTPPLVVLLPLPPTCLRARTGSETKMDFLSSFSLSLSRSLSFARAVSIFAATISSANENASPLRHALITHLDAAGETPPFDICSKVIVQGLETIRSCFWIVNAFNAVRF